mgnify:FL=1
MKYKNPIILCDYSDPDVCRIGDDFYMVASSFNFVPGLPILHSTDLVNWQLVNYACKTIPLPGYEKVQNARGIWAPSIRFHDGKFFIFVGLPDEGIYFTQATNPLEDWSELKCVWSGKGFIDPCPLWEKDENNNERLFVVHGYAKSRIGFNSKLGLLEVNPSNFNAISDDKIIFDGRKTQPTIEGPKFYKRNGYYYIFAPAGGVTNGWQTVLRSKKIDCEYEEKIVLAQGKSKINGPHQGAWVETRAGEDWFIHFQDAGIYGRITHLQPMRWVNDWPVMGNTVSLPDEKALSVVGEPVKKWKAPASRSERKQRQQREHLIEDAFQNSANPSKNTFCTNEASLWHSPAVCTKKIDTKEFTYERKFVLSEKAWRTGERRGIIFLGNEYAALQITKTNEGSFLLAYLESTGSENGDDERQEKILWSKEIFTNVTEEANNQPEFVSESILPECATGGNLSLVQKSNYRKLDNQISVSLRMKFHPDKDGRSGIVQFFVKDKISGKKLAFKSKPFKTINAHWVGGRYGWF